MCYICSLLNVINISCVPCVTSTTCVIYVLPGSVGFTNRNLSLSTHNEPVDNTFPTQYRPLRIRFTRDSNHAPGTFAPQHHNSTTSLRRIRARLLRSTAHRSLDLLGVGMIKNIDISKEMNRSREGDAVGCNYGSVCYDGVLCCDSNLGTHSSHRDSHPG